MSWNFEVKDEGKEKLLKDIGNTILGNLPKGVGFTLLLFDFGEGGNLFYTSSARREDACATMAEFLRKQGYRGKVEVSPARGSGKSERPGFAVRKLPDDPNKVPRASIGGSGELGGFYCNYRGNLTEVIAAVESVLRGLRSLEIEPEVSGDPK